MKILTILSALLLVSCGYDPRKTDSHDVTTHCDNCKPLPYDTYEPGPMPQYPTPEPIGREPENPCDDVTVNIDSDNSNSNSNYNINHNHNNIDHDYCYDKNPDKNHECRNGVCRRGCTHKKDRCKFQD